MTKRWVIAEPEPALTQTLARELHLAWPLAQVLANRGYRDAETASRFLNPQLRQLGDPFDLVFCRNVMIYFDNATQRKVLERTHAAMRPGGLLYVGHSENFTESRDLFRRRGKTIYERV